MKLGVLLSRKDTERVSTKVVTLSLEDVGGDDLAPVTVQEGKGCREGRSGDTPEDCLGDDAPPARLSLVDGWGKRVRKGPFADVEDKPLMKNSSKRRDSRSWFLL